MRYTLLFFLTTSLAVALPISFKADIAPLLRNQCQSCHGTKEAKGDYRVDSYSELMRALKEEPARVIAGKSDKSLLLKLLTTIQTDERMPQKSGPLSKAQVELFRQWIDEGAKFDGTDPKTPLVEIIPTRHHDPPPSKYSRPLPITALAFTPDGQALAVSGLREITIWNLEGQLQHRIANMSQRTFALAWLPDGQTLLAGGGIPGELGEVRAFTPEGKLRAVVHQASDVVLDIQLDANASRLAVADAANAVTIFDPNDFSRERKIDNHSDWVMALAFSADNRFLASASRDHTAKIFDLKTSASISTYGGHKTAVQGVAFRADGKEVFSVDHSGALHVWESGLADIDGKRFGAKKVADIKGLSHDQHKILCIGNSLFTYGSNGEARLFQADNRKALKTFEHTDGWLMSMAWHGKSQRVATGAHDGTVCLWDIRSGKQLNRFLALPH